MHAQFFLIIAPMHFYHGINALLVVGHTANPLLHIYAWGPTEVHVNFNLLCDNKLHDLRHSCVTGNHIHVTFTMCWASKLL